MYVLTHKHIHTHTHTMYTPSVFGMIAMKDEYLKPSNNNQLHVDESIQPSAVAANRIICIWRWGRKVEGVGGDMVHDCMIIIHNISYDTGYGGGNDGNDGK